MEQIVNVPESVTVRSAEAFKECLAAAVETDDSIILDLGEIVEADLSFVQLLYAMRADFARKNKTLQLAQPAAGPVADVLERAGFLTDAAPADIDFWFHGDLPR